MAMNLTEYARQLRADVPADVGVTIDFRTANLIVKRARGLVSFCVSNRAMQEWPYDKVLAGVLDALAGIGKVVRA